MVEPIALRPGVVMEGRFDDEELTKVWLTGVHHMLRQCRGRVVLTGEEDGWMRNYNWVHVEAGYDKTPMWILFDSEARLVAAAVPPEPHSAFGPFLDVPHPESFTQFGLSVATPEQLGEPLRPHHFECVTSWEAETLKYFSTESVGDAVFNHYD
ncbi:MAG: hypothetical protein Q4G51_09005 [Dermatophilus congolensis]|nr:hypothetical protein [Dermatophilus congolensis]